MYLVEIKEQIEQFVEQFNTIFSCRLHGKRASKTRQLMKDLVEEDSNESAEG